MGNSCCLRLPSSCLHTFGIQHKQSMAGVCVYLVYAQAMNTVWCVGGLTITLATGTVAHRKLRLGRRQGQGRKQWWGLGQGLSQQLALGRGQGRMGPEVRGQEQPRTAPERNGWGRLPGLRRGRRPEWGLPRTEEQLEAQLFGESLQNCCGSPSLKAFPSAQWRHACEMLWNCASPAKCCLRLLYVALKGKHCLGQSCHQTQLIEISWVGGQ